MSAACADYFPIEMIASQILIYDAQQVPDLLQTEKYAAAVAAASPSVPEPGKQPRLVEMKLARQLAVMGERPEFTAIIGEGALRQAVGGAEVMHGQLAWLVAVSAGCPWVTVQVLPFACGAHAAIGSGSMAVLRFAGSASLGVCTCLAYPDPVPSW